MSDKIQLRAVLGSQTEDKSVHAQALLKVINSAPSPEERAELLALAFVERDTVTKTPKALPNKGLPDDTRASLAKTHGDLTRGHLKMAFFKTHTAKDFAVEVLRFLDFLEGEDEKTFALGAAVFSPYIPYQELPGTPIHMSEQEYQHKLASDSKRVGLIDYIVNLPFDERTEFASMLLQVIDDSTDRELRVALLSHADFMRAQRMRRILKEED